MAAGLHARRAESRGSGRWRWTRRKIERLIKESLPDAQVSIEDLRGDGDHYAAHVVSGAFRGKSRVQQHQLVYQALRGRMGNELHALALQTERPRGLSSEPPRKRRSLCRMPSNEDQTDGQPPYKTASASR